MEATARIEKALTAALAAGEAPGGPPRLTAALRYAVFPAGARIRPRLCLAVAEACGEDHPDVVDAAAASIELLHCASLVHDDLPCFDDAGMRRGRPAVHRAFGERLAVLSGDALIALAFHSLAGAASRAPQRVGPLLAILGGAVGLPFGIAAGQAWECESHVALVEYQRAKTGALFAGATMAAAAACGTEPEPWRALGERLGEAYQVADDLRDVAGDPQELGKPTGRDAALGRPSAAAQLGVAGAVRRLEHLVAGAIDSIPACAGRPALQSSIVAEARGLVPSRLAGLARRAA